MSSFCPSRPSTGRTRFFLTVPSFVAKKRRSRLNDGSRLSIEGGLASIAYRDPGKADSGAQGFRHRDPQGIPEQESESPLASGGSLQSGTGRPRRLPTAAVRFLSWPPRGHDALPQCHNRPRRARPRPARREASLSAGPVPPALSPALGRALRQPCPRGCSGRLQAGRRKEGPSLRTAPYLRIPSMRTVFAIRDSTLLSRTLPTASRQNPSGNHRRRSGG